MNSATANLEKPRIEKTVPRFIEPMLQRDWDVLSIGCGAGTDVIKLRQDGYRASGLDPSRLLLESIPEPLRQFFRIGTAQDRPFGDTQFDFAYALDVIEHVGCIEFGTRLEPDARAIRRDFLASAFSHLKVGGSLLLTTSNKLCPIDVGHWHRYHRLGRRFASRKKPGVSIPWDRRNFLLSVGDIRSLMIEAVGASACKVEAVPAARYPSFTERKKLMSVIGKVVLHVLDARPLRGSPLAPLLIVKISRLE